MNHRAVSARTSKPGYAGAGIARSRTLCTRGAAPVILQLFFVSRIMKHVGLRAALVLIPLASTVGYGATLFVPLIEVFLVARVVDSSLDYSLSNTTQQTLWLVTTREAKYKAKQVIDTYSGVALLVVST